MPGMKRKKKSVARVVVGNLMKKYKMQGWSEKSFNFSKKRRTLETEDQNNSTRHESYANSIKSKVKTFFTRDDVSSMTTCRKQTITRNKLKMQKHNAKSSSEVSG